MAIHIRDATVRDLPRIIEIERLAFPAPWTLASFQRELTLPFSRIMVALPADSNLIAGFLCRWLIADECHILSVAVAPQFRRTGIGEILMGEAIAEAAVKGVAIITLEVRRSNLAARNLYRKLNFAERRIRKNYYGPGEDAIIMERRLNRREH